MITDKDVSYVADLANLELTPEERERMVKDLGSILSYIERLNELDTSSVAPMAQVFTGSEAAGPAKNAAAQAWREDVLAACLPHDEALRNAPVKDKDFFKVPKVIER
ncbi:MAG TPA: Asp-tRNA(Asn)/Glu-tRNA(Gln) amidotransferase subunit GatC [Candidatus Acidoferrales bacterium]|jgi:aspartyl-tRNA(Asn)/glutamyl-tRNA(Gln) amidotransferase subunit C|nr:Asp-tRNA(Asn)/Glu-tRNA(Gln) amidotransferase subunit GatC [Candidatus Acidoferrales bacterium]